MVPTDEVQAVPPLLNLVICNFVDLEDEDEMNTPAPSRVQFSEGTNRLTFGSGSYPEGAHDWTPSSALLVTLKTDMASVVHHPDLMNQWVASSCATLTDLMVRWGPRGMSRPKSHINSSR